MLCEFTRILSAPGFEERRVWSEKSRQYVLMPCCILQKKRKKKKGTHTDSVHGYEFTFLNKGVIRKSCRKF